MSSALPSKSLPLWEALYVTMSVVLVILMIGVYRNQRTHWFSDIMNKYLNRKKKKVGEDEMDEITT